MRLAPGGTQTGTDFVELLEPNLGSLPQYLAHVAKRCVGRTPSRHICLEVLERSLDDVQPGVQFGQVVGTVGQLFGVQRLFEGLVGAPHTLESLPDIAVALGAVTGRGAGSILQPADLRTDLRRSVALGVRRHRSWIRKLGGRGRRRKQLETT